MFKELEPKEIEIKAPRPNEDEGIKIRRALDEAANETNVELAQVTKFFYFSACGVSVVSIALAITKLLQLQMIDYGLGALALAVGTLLTIFVLVITPLGMKTGEGKWWEEFLGVMWLPFVLALSVFSAILILEAVK